MTIRAAWKKKQRSQQTQATTAQVGGSQVDTPRESDIATTVVHGSPNEQDATTVHPANGPIPDRVGVAVLLARSIQRIENELAELKRQLQRLPWSKLDE